MNKLTLQHKIFIVKYFQYGNVQRVREEWINEYGDERNPSHRDTIYHLRDRFHQNGTVADLLRLGWSRGVRTAEMADYMCPLLLHKAVACRGLVMPGASCLIVCPHPNFQVLKNVTKTNT